MKLTLDTNCLINLEEGTGQAVSVRRLIDLHRQNAIQVFLSGSSAGENLPGKIAPTNYNQFEQRLDRLDVSDLPVMRPLARLDVSFFLDFSELASEADVALEQEILAVLSSEGQSYGGYLAEQGLPPDTPIDSQWRNRYSDVDVMLLHIRSGHDVLVTEDRHFLSVRRRKQVLELGAGEIVTPEDALRLVKSQLGI